MTPQDTRVRSMKARRTGSTCPECKRLIVLGDIITRHGGRWYCTACAIAVATGKPAPQTRTAP